MKVHILIPAYNSSSTLLETLTGIDEAARNYSAGVDVMFVDDCSKDNTYEIANSYKPEYFKLEIIKNAQNLGERGTINKYFAKIKKESTWAFLIHADDIPKSNWIQRIVEEIKKCNQNEIFTVWSSFDTFDHLSKKIEPGDDEGTTIVNTRTFADAEKYIRQISSNYHVSGAAFNLNLFEQIKGFDAKMPQYGDTDFFVKGILAGFSDIYIKCTLTQYRLISTSISMVTKQDNRDIFEIDVLINRYQHCLSSESIKAMRRQQSSRLIKRTIKAFLSFNLKAAISNFGLTLTCFFK